MSTYLQGVTDTGFNPIKYTPNFPYMINALQKAQAKYDANFNEIASSYDTISNSLLLNPENNEYRKQFLEQSKEQLKQLSSKDLSLRANVDEAEKIFAPFWEDNDMLADYKISKQYQAQVDEYNRLKNSDKKEDRDRAWDWGKAYVDLTVKEMSLAKRGDGSIQSVKVRPYIDYKNVNEEITKELANMGYKDGVSMNPQVTNGYIAEIKNGAGSEQTYAHVISNILKNRPDLVDVFKVMGVTSFENSVYNYMKQYSVPETEARLQVKKQYAADKITEYDKFINNYNNVLNDNDKGKGLKSELKELELSVSSKLQTGEITLNSPIAVEYLKKLNKYNEITGLVNNYTQLKNSLSSEDYMKSSGEDYFTKIFTDQFVETQSSGRAAATQYTIKTDSAYIAAQRLEEDWKKMMEKFNQDALIDANANGIIDTGDYRLGTQSGSNQAGGKSLETTLNEKSQKIKENLEIPSVGGVFGKTEDLQKSMYVSLLDNTRRYGSTMVDSGIKLVQSANLDIPNMSTYLEYLTNPVSKKYENNKFKENQIKEAYDALKKAKVINDDIKSYNQNPVKQLNQIVSYITSMGDLTQAQIENKILYEQSSKTYLAANDVLKRFDSDYESKIPEKGLVIYTYKSKDNKYKPIDAEYIVKQYNSQLEKINKQYFPNYKSDIKLPIEIARAYLNGTLKLGTDKTTEASNASPTTNITTQSTVVGPYVATDPKTGIRYDMSPLVNYYGTPEKVASTLKEYNEHKSEQLKTYVKDISDNSFVMNRSLIFKNSPDTLNNTADKIAYDAFIENKERGNVTKEGVVKPLNYDEIDGNNDIKDEIINLIFSNKVQLDKVLSTSEISYTGKTADQSYIKLNFTISDLASLIKAPYILEKNMPADKYTEVLKSIAANGIELSMSKDLYNTYAQNQYMSSLVSDQMLNTGIKQSDFEENNLYYKYNITKGANNTIVATVQTAEYDPKTKSPNYFITRPVSTTFPGDVSIDEIMRLIRESTSTNTSYVLGLIKNEKLKNKANSIPKNPNESDDEYIKRVFTANQNQ